MTLDCILISSDNQRIYCKYYEIESKCIEIIEKYCNQSEENWMEFNQFSKDYNTFKPYFDFVICRLKYKLQNTQMELGKTLSSEGSENYMYVYDNDSMKKEKTFRYSLSDDTTMNIYPMSLNNITEDCVIDGNNNHIMPNNMKGHVPVLNQLLNLLLISNKNACEEFLDYKYDVHSFLSSYLSLMCFRVDIQKRTIITQTSYRGTNITKTQRSFIEELLDNRYTYPSYLYDIDTLHPNTINVNVSLKYSNQYIERKNNEYRRF